MERSSGGGADLPWVGSVKAGRGYESEKMIAPHITMDVLNDGKEALRLILDEAQRLWRLAQTKDHRADDASNLLNAIHDGEFERPVILTAAGLGATRQAFRDIKVSRFEGDSFVGPGRLREAYTRDILRDWLVKEAGAKGNPHPGLTRSPRRPTVGQHQTPQWTTGYAQGSLYGSDPIHA